MFSGVYWNHPVCLSVCVSVCVQNTSFCQSAGRGIKSHLVTALVDRGMNKASCHCDMTEILLKAG